KGWLEVDSSERIDGIIVTSSIVGNLEEVRGRRLTTVGFLFYAQLWRDYLRKMLGLKHDTASHRTRAEAIRLRQFCRTAGTPNGVRVPFISHNANSRRSVRLWGYNHIKGIFQKTC